eukprot:scaffold72766_cov48-Prasinocladus_malaysianus.AAC.1
MTAQFVILPSLVMFNTFASLGGLGTQAIVATGQPSANPIYAIYYDFLLPWRSFVPYLGAAAYYSILVFWVVRHSRREYIGWLYHVVMVISLSIGCVTFTMLISQVATASLHEVGTGVALVLLMQLTSLGAPVISSLAMGDSYGILVSIVNVPFMLAFFPMWIFLGAYSLARFADFTWGNRPHESESQDGAKRSAYMKACRTIGTLVSFMYLAGNLLLFALLIAVSTATGVSPLMVNAVLAIPYALTSLVGLVYNVQYAARYRWANGLRRVAAALNIGGKLTSTTGKTAINNPNNEGINAVVVSNGRPVGAASPPKPAVSPNAISTAATTLPDIHPSASRHFQKPTNQA